MNEPRIYIQMTGGEQISDRLRGALDGLSRALADAEMLPDVEGFNAGPGALVDIGGTRLPGAPGAGRPGGGTSPYGTRPENHFFCVNYYYDDNGKNCWVYFP